MLFRGICLSGGSFFGGNFMVRGAIFLGGNYPRGQLSRGQLSKGQFSLGAIVLQPFSPNTGRIGIFFIDLFYTRLLYFVDKFRKTDEFA